MKTATVHSSHGDITIDAQTGVVISHGNNTEYADIARFDLEEYRAQYPDEKEVRGYDILDLGYFLKDGTYEEPDHHWRRDCAIERQMVADGQVQVWR
jgi:hypothetical protein